MGTWFSLSYWMKKYFPTQEEMDQAIAAAIDTRVNELINGAPGALDTLNELAAALGNDENFATTIVNELGTKVDKVTGKGLSTQDFTTPLLMLLSSFNTANQLVKLDGTGALPALDGSALLGIANLPTGAIIPYGGSTAPNASWLLAQGQEISRSTYAGLFGIYGTTYGGGDGSLTFNLPDLRGRVIVSAGQGTDLTNRVLAAMSGAETHALAGNESPPHTHDTQAIGAGNYQYFTTGSRISVNTTNYIGNGAAHNNMQPYIVLNHIVKV